MYLKYHPISTDIIPKLYSVSSMTSMFENFCNIPEQTDADALPRPNIALNYQTPY